MLAEVRSFDDSQQHAGSILGWNQVYDQLGRGHLSSELQQVAAERFQIFQETLDKRVVQHGCAPRGRLCIAMSLGAGRFPVVQGYEAGPQSVPLLRDGEEFLLHAPEGMSFFAINIDAERFARLAEVELSREQLGALRTQPQMAVSRAVLERVRSRIQPVFSALVKGDIVLDRACEARLEEQLLETFLGPVHPCAGHPPGPPWQCRRVGLPGAQVPGDRPGQHRRVAEHPRALRATAGQPSHPAEQLPTGGRHAPGGIPAHPAPECGAPPPDQHARERAERW